jgi:hypothetical protein
MDIYNINTKLFYVRLSSFTATRRKEKPSTTRAERLSDADRQAIRKAKPELLRLLAPSPERIIEATFAPASAPSSLRTGSLLARAWRQGTLRHEAMRERSALPTHRFGLSRRKLNEGALSQKVPPRLSPGSVQQRHCCLEQ